MHVKITENLFTILRPRSGFVKPIVAVSVTNPAFRAEANASAGGMDITINKPAGTIETDDMLAIFFHQTAAVWTPPAGWSLVEGETIWHANHRFRVYAKTAGAGEPANYQWTQSVNSLKVGCILTISNPANFADFGTESNVSPAVSTPDITPGSAGNLVVVAFGAITAVGGSIANPVGFDSRFSNFSAGMGSYQQISTGVIAVAQDVDSTVDMGDGGETIGYAARWHS